MGVCMKARLFAASAIVFAAPALAAGTSGAQTSPAATQRTVGEAAMTSAVAQTDTGPLTPEQQRQLIQELQSLRDRVTTLENRATQVQVTPAAPVAHKAGDNRLELYGFVQLDAIQDFKRVNPNWDATLRPSRIPTVKGQFGSDGQSIFSARQSRLGAKATGMLAGKPYEE